MASSAQVLICALPKFYFVHCKWLEEQSGRGCLIISPEYDPLSCKPLTPEEYVEYLDPLNCKCRAYARLNQGGREEALFVLMAMRCLHLT